MWCNMSEVVSLQRPSCEGRNLHAAAALRAAWWRIYLPRSVSINDPRKRGQQQPAYDSWQDSTRAAPGRSKLPHRPPAFSCKALCGRAAPLWAQVHFDEGSSSSKRRPRLEKTLYSAIWSCWADSTLQLTPVLLFCFIWRPLSSFRGTKISSKTHVQPLQNEHVCLI